MATFSHGLHLYCLFSIVSVVFTFEAGSRIQLKFSFYLNISVPDISRFENMRSRRLQLDDPLNNHERVSIETIVTSPILNVRQTS